MTACPTARLDPLSPTALASVRSSGSSGLEWALTCPIAKPREGGTENALSIRSRILRHAPGSCQWKVVKTGGGPLGDTLSAEPSNPTKCFARKRRTCVCVRKNCNLPALWPNLALHQESVWNTPPPLLDGPYPMSATEPATLVAEPVIPVSVATLLPETVPGVALYI